MVFSEKWKICIAAKVGISDTGMAIAVIRVARQSFRKKNTTTAASSMPSNKVCRVAVKFARVLSTVDRILVKATSGWSCSSFLIALSTLSSTVMSEESRVFITWKPTTGRSSSRAKPAISAAPSPISATSDRRTKRPPAIGIWVSRSCSTVAGVPSTRTVWRRPPTSTWPPVWSDAKPLRASLIWGAVTPKPDSLSGSTMTLISRLAPPTRWTWATPSAACRAREMVSSMNHDRPTSDILGPETA